VKVFWLKLRFEVPRPGSWRSWKLSSLELFNFFESRVGAILYLLRMELMLGLEIGRAGGRDSTDWVFLLEVGRRLWA